MPSRIARCFTMWIAAAALTVAATSHAADAAALCQSKKLRAAGVAAGGLLRCHSRAASGGQTVDTGCVSAERTRLEIAFSRAEGPGACRISGDGSGIATTLEADAAQIAAALRPSSGGSTSSSTKHAATGGELSLLLKSYAKQRKLPNDARFLGRASDMVTRLESDFARAEGAAGCSTTGDAPSIADRLELAIERVVEPLWPAAEVGVTFTRPSGWRIDAGILALSRADTLSFANHTLPKPRGPIPPGGADITVTRAPLPQEGLRAHIAGRLSGSANAAAVTVTIAGESATRTKGDIVFEGGGTVRTYRVFLPHSPDLFTFSLSYGLGDEWEGSFLAKFDAVVSSIAFPP